MTILVLTHERIIELSAHHQVTDKCFKKCITSPGSSMGSSDQKCVAMCMDRFALFVPNLTSLNIPLFIQVHGLLQPSLKSLHKAVTAGNVNAAKKTVSSQASTRYLQSFHNMLGSSPSLATTMYQLLPGSLCESKD